MSRTSERSADFQLPGRVILLERDADDFEEKFGKLEEKLDALKRAIFIASVTTTTASIGLAINALILGVNR